MTSQTVQIDEVKCVINRILTLPVVNLTEELKLCNESGGVYLDPNLLMNTRHEMIRKSLPVDLEEENILKIYEQNEERKNREEKYLKTELKRFEKHLLETRPKFSDRRSCSKKFFVETNDENFWSQVMPNTCSKNQLEKKFSEEKTLNSIFPGTIKITITDKSTFMPKENNEEILRKTLKILKENARNKKRSREIKLQVQQLLAERLLRRYFNAWKNLAQGMKRLALKRKESKEMTHERKIELFVSAIFQKQEEFSKNDRGKKEVRGVKSAPELDARSKIASRHIFIADSPAHCRLEAQRKIIEKQKEKLEEQKKLIQEMRSKDIETHARNASRRSLEAVKDVSSFCEPSTKRAISRLIKREGYGDELFIEKPLRVPSPPKFLIQMEARAEARRRRAAKAKEDREKRILELKKMEEIARNKEEEELKQMQIEARREAKRLRKEQEQRKIREAERAKQLTEISNHFYHRNLLQRYVIDGFKKLLEIKRTNLEMAERHHCKKLLLKYFTKLKNYAMEERKRKWNSAVLIHERNLLMDSMLTWKLHVLEEKRMWQVACDYHDMKLQQQFLQVWIVYTKSLQKRNMQIETKIRSLFEKRILETSFQCWRNFLKIAEEEREHDRRKNEFRALVRIVIPDFDPGRI